VILPPRLRRALLRGRRATNYLDEPWAKWLTAMYPRSVTLQDGRVEFAQYHREAWAWAWGIDDTRPPAFLAVWPRDSGKSTHAELIATYLGLTGKRRYCIYACSSQDRADQHVAAIRALLESPVIEQNYPEHAERKMSKYQQSLGWRVNRLRTSGGFTVDAIGLDKLVRGARMEDQRPDLIILDDVDEHTDSARAVNKKEEKLTHSIIPAGARDTCAIFFAQNLIHGGGVLSRLVFGRSDYLRRRIISGPHPAIRNLAYEVQGTPPDVRTVVTGGTPMWRGFSLETCQQIVDDIGMSAFQREYQQQVAEGAGALWTTDLIDQHRSPAPRDVTLNVVAIDPQTSKARVGSETGIIQTLYASGHAYPLRDASGFYSPDDWARRALQLYDQYPSSLIVAERNNGGDLVEANIRHLRPDANITTVWASKSKHSRAEECVALYERGEVHHVGVLSQLEEQMTTPYDPDAEDTTWDRVDALVWGLHALFFRRDREEHFDRRRHVVPSKRVAVPTYQAVETTQVEDWMVQIERGERITCTKEEYGAARKLLQDALLRFSSQRDPRGQVVMETLAAYDAEYGRESL